MATALTANPYPGPSPAFRRAPQHPPSPPIDDFQTKCTLPSIQSLIGVMADSTSADPSQQAKSEQESSLPPPPNHANSSQPADVRSQTCVQPPVSSPRVFPPSPPVRSHVDFDQSYQSPSATSSHSSAAPTAPYYGSVKSPSNVDPQLEQRHPPPASHPGHDSHPSASESPYQNSPYPPSPTNATAYTYPPPNQSVTATPPAYYQRPLPTNFPPAPAAAVPMDPALAASPQRQSPIDQTNPWQHQHQHHHYISPSSSAAYSGQSQDRYICATCSKAFSRPSSLRIHSHSHTGEKPFKCPHPGCGKAFSVRSNMKRHERGCHGGSSPGEV
ncbi:MAG: hypothetical protein LQ350_000800 [Teloschistes chrysophthalmus]|nr:MAG: hypothetical protein LQ350_000800 [Niorma chrysophthalma]